MCYHPPMHPMTKSSSLTLLSPLPHLTLCPLIFPPIKSSTLWDGNIKVHIQLGLFYIALIFCPLRGRGLVLSCLSARQCYLSITKPSAVQQRPQHCINPLSARQPSITLLSITSDPSSAHLSHTAHAQKWSTRRVPLASGSGGTAGQEEIRGKGKKQKTGVRDWRLFPALPSHSLSLHAAESVLFISLHAY